MNAPDYFRVRFIGYYRSKGDPTNRPSWVLDACYLVDTGSGFFVVSGSLTATSSLMPYLA